MIDPILKSLGTTFFVLASLSSPARALETWSLPLEPELKTLRVSNLTSQPQWFWMQAPRVAQTNDLPEDRSYQINPYATFEIPLNDFSRTQWLRLLADEKKIFQIQIETSSETQVLLNAGSTTRWKVRAQSHSELVIFNQAPFEQKVQLALQNSSSFEIPLKSLEKIHWAVPENWSGGMITISGSARLGGFLLSSSGPRALIPDPSPVTLPAPAAAAYFRLSNKNGSQSYVVALSTPELIDQARKQILEPKAFLSRILIAKVETGHGDFNRDFSSAWKSPWSWHISQVFRFADLASQECDGSPELLEETLAPWLKNSPVICFWNYRVVEELSASQVSTARPEP